MQPMIILLRVVPVMVHRPTVYPVVTRRPVPRRERQKRRHLSPIGKHHLEPQIRPAEVTHRLLPRHLDLLGDEGRYPHDLAVNEVREVALVHLGTHMLEDFPGTYLFALEVVT